jgi:uncharacterized protein
MLAADPATGEIRRFLVGPRGCEITGMVQTPDLRTLFINVQHPGELPLEHPPRNDPKNPKAVSSWPDRPSGARPRSATIAIRRTSGRNGFHAGAVRAHSKNETPKKAR